MSCIRIVDHVVTRLVPSSQGMEEEEDPDQFVKELHHVNQDASVNLATYGSMECASPMMIVQLVLVPFLMKNTEIVELLVYCLVITSNLLTKLNTAVQIFVLKDASVNRVMFVALLACVSYQQLVQDH